MTTSPATHVKAFRARAVRLAAACAVAFVALAVLAVFASAAFADPTPIPQPLPTPPGTVPTQPPATPNPTPGPIIPAPTAPPTTTPAPGDEAPGLFDLPGQIRAALNEYFAKAAETSTTSVLNVLGETLLTTPDLTNNTPVRAAWTATLIVANSLLVLFVVLGGYTVMARNTLQDHVGLKDVLPRIAVGAVAANVSLIVIGKAIEGANAITNAIAGTAVDPTAVAHAFAEAATASTLGNDFLLSMLRLAVVVMAIVAVIMFILRIVMMVLVIASAPLALMCHASTHTEPLAYLWWRALAATLGLQITQAIVLLVTLNVFLTPAGPTVLGVPTSNDGLLRILICLTMLWLLIKLPGLARRLVLGPLMKRQGRGLIGQVIHAVLLIKALGLTGGGGSRRGTTPAPRTPRPPRRPATPTPNPARVTPRPPRPLPQAVFSHPPTTPPTPTPAAGTAQPRFTHGALPAGTPAAAGPALGTATAPFSHRPQPSSTPAPAGPPPPARFSATPTPPVSGRPHAGATTPTFSDPRTPPAASTPPTRPAPPARFSAAPATPAPRHPPAPPVRTPPARQQPPAGPAWPRLRDEAPPPPTPTPPAPRRPARNRPRRSDDL